MLVSPAFRSLADFGLTTAEILYRRPDTPSLLQTYIWQDEDVFPHFPQLKTFLDFWERALEGRLHSVRVAHQRLIKATDMTFRDGVFQLQ